MDTLKGFAVLTGPLWLILILVPLSVWVAVKLSKKYKRRGVAGIGFFLLVFLVPFGDEIAGRIYLVSLCATKAGYEVYDTIELADEYWDEQGRPKFFSKRGANNYDYLDNSLDRKHLDVSDHTVSRYSILLQIDKSVFVTRETVSMRKLGKTTSFRFWGGWIRREFSPHNSANSCTFRKDQDFQRNYYGQIFVRK